MSGAATKPKYEPTPKQSLALREKSYTDMNPDEFAYMAKGLRCQRPLTMYDAKTQTIIYKNCESRRWDQCPYCANLWVGDVIRIMKEGVTPDRLKEGVFFFGTLTGPPFGPVHRAAKEGEELIQCIPQCRKYHKPEEGIAGVPFSSEYDHLGQARWNLNVGVLLNRFFTDFNKRLGLGEPVARVQTREMQTRFLVHFHMVFYIRWMDIERLGGIEAVEQAFRDAATVRYKKRDNLPPLVWGKQIDIQPILPALGVMRDLDNAATAEAVEAKLAYICKYLRKDLGVDKRFLSYRQYQHLTRLNACVRELIKDEYLAARNKVNFYDPDFKRKQARIVHRFNRIAESAGVRINPFGKSSTWAKEMNLETQAAVRRGYNKASSTAEASRKGIAQVAPASVPVVPDPSPWKVSRSLYLPTAAKQHDAYDLTSEERWLRFGPKQEVSRRGVDLSIEPRNQTGVRFTLRRPELSVHGVFPSFLDLCDEPEDDSAAVPEARRSGGRLHPSSG